MTYPSRIIGWPRFIHPGWKIMLDAGRFPFYAARFTAASGLYTDTALTVPVTSYGDAVAGWRGAGLIGVQPTLTARPAYGRMPEVGVRNLLGNVGADSENLNSALWTPRVGGSALYPVSVGAYSLSQITGAASQGAGVGTSVGPVLTLSSAYRFRAVIAQGSATLSRMGIYNSSTTWLFRIDVAWSAGVPYTSGSSGLTTPATYTPLGDGAYLVETTFVTPSSLTGNTDLIIQPDRNGTSGTILVGYVQFSETTADVPYQKVTSLYDVTQSGVPDTPVLYYDLGDDVLPSAMELPEVTGGTLVIAGEKGIWIEDSFNHAGGSWSLGPTTYTGGPSGLLPSLIGNRALGFAVFAGQLTPEQLQVEVAYWMARGAPGVWDRTSLWDNAPTDVGTNWTDVGGGVWSNDGGGASAQRLAKADPSPGALYEINVTVDSISGGSVREFSGGSVPLFSATTPGRYRAVAPKLTTDNIGIVATSTTVCQVSGIETFRLTLNTDPYP